ncbi:MAG: NUDIX domain-containing protein [Bacteroidales bacterium]
MEKPLGVAGKAVINKSGKILLLQRARNEAFEPGLWELPGGKLNYGEDLIDALEREVREEAGLSVKVGLPFKTWHLFKDAFWITGITFCCEFTGGRISLSAEHDAFVWIEPGEYIQYTLGSRVKEQINAFLALKRCND